ncbi:MAG: hypothetical protein CMJ84_09400 [Planctomycetes bacterium]|jgi:hypothetical protein|nr:hypothetical protein [Planctomycetota bacterium]MDP6408372.1 hypothetical protein [Planctomycetota bacterium]
MRRLGRHLAADVLRHTVAAAAVVATLSLVQSAFRYAHELGASTPGRIAAKAIEAAFEHLLACWPLACAVGFSGAIALWVARRQHTIVACAGLPLARISAGALALSLAVLAAGDALLSARVARPDRGRVSWATGEVWGAALREGEGEWRWIEFRPTAAGPQVREGRAASLADLAAAVPFVAPAPADLAGFSNHGLFVLLVAALALRAAQASARWMGPLAYGGPLVLWLQWTRWSAALSGAFGAGIGAELLGSALAFSSAGALGIVLVHVARER